MKSNKSKMEIKTSGGGFLADILKHVKSGALVPAAFNRPYRWGKKDVEALCDSILTGFPIGSFVVWEPEGAAEISIYGRARLGPITGFDANNKPVGMLLDGQNRMASAAWMMTDLTQVSIPDVTPDEQATWMSGETLTIDLATNSIRFIPNDEAQNGLRIPAWVALDRWAGMNHLQARMASDWKDLPKADVDAMLRWYDDVQFAFQNTRIVTTVISRATAEEAQHAFKRICKVGVPISDEDLAEAFNWKPPVLAEKPDEPDAEAMRP